MSINIIKKTDSMGVVTLIKKIPRDDGRVDEVVITDPEEYAHYIVVLDKIDNGDRVSGRLA